MFETILAKIPSVMTYEERYFMIIKWSVYQEVIIMLDNWATINEASRHMKKKQTSFSKYRQNLFFYNVIGRKPQQKNTAILNNTIILTKLTFMEQFTQSLQINIIVKCTLEIY